MTQYLVAKLEADDEVEDTKEYDNYFVIPMDETILAGYREICKSVSKMALEVDRRIDSVTLHLDDVCLQEKADDLSDDAYLELDAMLNENGFVVISEEFYGKFLLTDNADFEYIRAVVDSGSVWFHAAGDYESKLYTCAMPITSLTGLLQTAQVTKC